MRSPSTRRLIYIAVLLVILALIAGRLFLSSNDPQGEGNAWCDRVDMSPSRNGELVVSMHNTFCSGMGGSSAYYVYLHKEADDESGSNLIFRYFESGGMPPPTVEWVGPRELKVHAQGVRDVSKKVQFAEGVHISYDVVSD